MLKPIRNFPIIQIGTNHNKWVSCRAPTNQVIFTFYGHILYILWSHSLTGSVYKKLFMFMHNFLNYICVHNSTNWLDIIYIIYFKKIEKQNITFFFEKTIIPYGFPLTHKPISKWFLHNFGWSAGQRRFLLKWPWTSLSNWRELVSPVPEYRTFLYQPKSFNHSDM